MKFLSKQGTMHTLKILAVHERLLSIDKINNKIVGKDKLLHKGKNQTLNLIFVSTSIQVSLLLKQ